jgi:hypothetical protein
MADISKEDLKKEIQEILKDADLDNTSAKKVSKLSVLRSRRRLILVETEPLPDAAPAAPVY